jgi:hypothetical protein
LRRGQLGSNHIGEKGHKFCAAKTIEGEGAARYKRSKIQEDVARGNTRELRRE